MESDSFIFDDDIEEIGSDVEAFCPKCKADTAHTIITKYEDEIRRVQCSPCGDVHAYRKPRGELEEEGAQAEEKSKKKALKKPTWEEFFAKHDVSSARPYTFRDTYIENDIVTHPKFGMGFASETPDEDKVEITFKDQRRVLVHNRKELPGAPPELARAPKPRPLPKPVLKGKKGKAAQQQAAALGAPVLTKAELAAQKKAAKEAARLQKEQERAEAKAKKEAERAAMKAKLEAERAAKKAKIEKERAAKKAKLEALRAKNAAKAEALRKKKQEKLEKLRAAKQAKLEKAQKKKAEALKKKLAMQAKKAAKAKLKAKAKAAKAAKAAKKKPAKKPAKKKSAKKKK